MVSRRKLLKSLEVCKKEGIHFVPLAWESTGGATDTVHATIRKWTDLEGARSGYAAHLIRRNLYADLLLSPKALGTICDRSPCGARL